MDGYFGSKIRQALATLSMCYLAYYSGSSIGMAIAGHWMYWFPAIAFGVPTIFIAILYGREFERYRLNKRREKDMSVKKFKVGDKVRVRTISDSRWRRNSLRSRAMMICFIGNTCIIESAHDGHYCVKENSILWLAEELEPVEKTLENLEKGDLINHKNGDTRKVLAVLDGCYLLSMRHDHQSASFWYTAHELEDNGWKPVQPEETATETIEIGGKKYNKQELEEAVKDLEPID